MDFEVGGCGGGTGVLELSAVKAVAVFTFERKKIKERKFGGRFPESCLCLGGIQVSAVCIDVELRRQTHFPILTSSCPVPAVLQKHCFIKETT